MAKEIQHYQILNKRTGRTIGVATDREIPMGRVVTADNSAIPESDFLPENVEGQVYVGRSRVYVPVSEAHAGQVRRRARGFDVEHLGFREKAHEILRRSDAAYVTEQDRERMEKLLFDEQALVNV